MKRQLLRGFSHLQHFYSTLTKPQIQLVKNYPLQKEYPNFKPHIIQSKPNATRFLKQGNLQFLVETSSFPGCTDLGICINLGTRDQDESTAGSLSCLKNFAHTKDSIEETVRYYDIFQKSGSFFKFEYDTSYTYAKCSLFAEDADLMLDLLLDLALSQKRMQTDKKLMTTELKEIKDMVRMTAYKHRGIGMPNSGIGKMLTNDKFVEFQKKITPFNTIFSFSNYPDEQKLIQTITNKLQKKYPDQFIVLQRQNVPRIPSPYVGGTQMYHNPKAQMFEFALAFQSCPYHSDQMELVHVLKTVLGNSASFSTGGPGKGMYARCTTNLMNTVGCVQKASQITHFSNDSGLFGLTVGGPQQSARQIVECTLEQFKKLFSGIPKDELDRAKNILIASIYTNTQGQPQRLQQITKHIFSYGRVKLSQYEQNINKVTNQDILRYLNQIVKSPPTYVAVSPIPHNTQYLQKLIGSSRK